MAKAELQNIADAIEHIGYHGLPLQISIDMNEDNNFYWLLKGIEHELGRIATALEIKNVEEA